MVLTFDEHLVVDTQDGFFILAYSYSKSMNELIALTHDLPEQRGITLILTKDRARSSKTDLIGNLIIRGPLFILSADEWLPGFLLPRMIRGHTTEIKALTSRLRTACASTSLRLLDSLSNIPSAGEPLLVLDFLHTFYDPNLHLSLRFRVLRQCCNHLKRIALHRPIIIMAQEMSGQEYDQFLTLLRGVAQKTLYLEYAPEPSGLQLALL